MEPTTAPSSSTTASSPGAPSTQITDIKQWVTERRKDATSPTPDGKIPQVQLESWLQVPDILTSIQDGNTRVRIIFPDEDNQITAEQQEISKFLIENAGKPLTELFALLSEEIRACHLVTSKEASHDEAQKYLNNLSRELKADSSQLLTIAEVVTLNDSFKPTRKGNPNLASGKKQERDLILGAVTQKMGDTHEHRTFIIEVPAGYESVAQTTLREKWSSLSEGNKPSAEHAKIWRLPDSDSVTVKEDDFLTFLNEDIPKTSPKKAASKKSNPNQPSAVTVGATE